jgi:hypothetical protein
MESTIVFMALRTGDRSPGEVKVKQHDDAGLGIEPGEGDDANPDRN